MTLWEKVVTPAAQREAVMHLRTAFEMSERRECCLVGIDQTSIRYTPRRRDDTELRDRLKALAQEHRRLGYCQLHALLRREGYEINRKRDQRIYR